MKYIKKLTSHPFLAEFENDVRELTSWGEFFSYKKGKLKKHILENEQKYLCIYCECKVNLHNSHLEHIKPKAPHQYPQFAFTYNNLTVSCEGNIFNPPSIRSKNNCGHRKENSYDPGLFLDPTKQVNIRDYFKYDFDDFKIRASKKNPAKANYMIKTLNLNDKYLLKARKNSLNSFNRFLRKIRDVKQRKLAIKKILDRENVSFVSFLRFKYKKFL